MSRIKDFFIYSNQIFNSNIIYLHYTIVITIYCIIVIALKVTQSKSLNFNIFAILSYLKINHLFRAILSYLNKSLVIRLLIKGYLFDFKILLIFQQKY